MRLTMNLAMKNLLLNLKLKLYFNNINNNNKNLIVYVNHALLVFYLCQSRRNKCYGFNSI